MIDFIFTPIRLALRLAGFAIVMVAVVTVGTMFFLSPAQADEKTVYEFDIVSPASLREYLSYFGTKWIFCTGEALQVGVASLPNGQVKLVCMTPKPMTDATLMKSCTTLGEKVGLPLVLVNRKDTRFWCGIPSKLIDTDDSTQDA